MAEGNVGSPGERRRKVSVPKIRTVLKQIGDEITNEELTKLIFLAGDQIPKGKTQDITTLKFFDTLQERQLIDTKQDNVDYLIELLGNLPRVDLVKKLTSTHPGSNIYTEKINVQERIEELNSCEGVDGVVVTNTEITENTWSVKQSNVTTDGGFLQDPHLVQSIFQNHHDMVTTLELVTKEKDKALATNADLKKKNTELQLEISSIRDDQNNLIWERNSALGAKSEYVFRESEMRKELSDLKRANNLLERTCTKANNDIEERDKKIDELTKSLEESVKTKNELLINYEQLKREKVTVEEKLAKLQKDEEDNGRVKCKRCGLVYVEANNAVDACRYHSGNFASVGSIKKKFEWSCCKNNNKNAPGCCKKKHLTIDFPRSPDDSVRKFTM